MVWIRNPNIQQWHQSLRRIGWWNMPCLAMTSSWPRGSWWFGAWEIASTPKKLGRFKIAMMNLFKFFWGMMMVMMIIMLVMMMMMMMMMLVVMVRLIVFFGGYASLWSSYRQILNALGSCFEIGKHNSWFCRRCFRDVWARWTMICANCLVKWPYLTSPKH